MKREFATLTPQEALHVAIFIEERNAQLYRDFSELFTQLSDGDSREIATVFQEMAEEERDHGAELQERYEERYGTMPCAVTDEEVREIIEMPNLDSGQLFAISKANLGLASRHKALEIALAAERTAMRFYNRLAQITPDDELRPTYAELAHFEHGHFNFIEGKMDLARKAMKGQDA